MKDYKLAAILQFCKERNLSTKLSSSTSIPYKLLNINNTPIYARFANTPETLSKGLMGVTQLQENEGCLLDFGYNTYASLWMKNCKINMQTAMIEPSGIITEIIDMSTSDPTRLHRSAQIVRYALEMSEDFFVNHHIKVGHQVKLL